MSETVDNDSINHLCRQLTKQQVSSFILMKKKQKYILVCGEDFNVEDIQKKYKHLDYFSFVKDFQNNTGHRALVITDNYCISHDEINIVNCDVAADIPILKLIKNNLEKPEGGIQSKYKIILTMIEKILFEEFLEFISFHSEMQKYTLDKESKTVLYKMFNNMLAIHKSDIENILDNIWVAYQRNNELEFIKWLKECSKKLSILLYIINVWVIIYYSNTEANIIMCYINKDNMMFVVNALENMNWKLYF
jgi:hypothetical protein